jgi:hypothetical protein
MRHLRMPAALLAAVVLTLAATGCGGSDKTYSGTKPDAWAATVCGALGEWAQGLQAGSARMQADLANAKDVKSVKNRFIVFLKEAESSAGVLLGKVKAAGAPAVKDGPAIQNDLETGLTEARASFTHAVEKAQKLPTKNLQAFTSGVTALGNDVQQELSAIGSDFNKLGDKYDDKALNEATSKDPACQKLTGTTS